MIGSVATVRRALYRRGILASRALPRPVVSVGNLTTGGTGKTPHVQFLARWLSGRGLRIAILSRGYGRRTRGTAWASASPRPPASEVGDEPALLAATLPGIPVVVGESRYEAGCECLRRAAVDAFLLDDGFQHLPLRRDADLLLVDASRGLGNRRTLPFGPLREPADSARLADALVVTGCRDAAQGESVASGVPFPPGKVRAYSHVVPGCLVDPAGRESAIPSAGTEVAAFSGLAANDRFLSTLTEAGLSVRRFLPFRDHHPYGASDLRRIADAAGGLPLVTTEKDLVRLPPDLPFAVGALRVTVEFLGGWGPLSELVLDRIGRGAGR